MSKIKLNSRFSILDSRGGFSLIELLIFAAIFSGMMIAFISLLVTITSIQARQGSVFEVNQQSQFLLQQVQQLTERSSLIELSQDIATTTLKLRMPSLSEDPTYITVSDGIVYLQQGNGPQNPLTSNKVVVSSLTFTKHSNPPGHDSVSVSFLISYNSPSIKQQFSETLNTAIARVSAATFDSNLIPSSTATFDLGVASNIWRSINNTIYFSGGNVGIGTTGPTTKLHLLSSSVQDGLTIDATTYPEILFSRAGTAKAWVGIAGSAGGFFSGSIADALILRSSAGPVQMGYTAGGSDGPTMTLSTTGNVGIGTTAPGAPLHVKGSMNGIGNCSIASFIQLCLESTSQYDQIAVSGTGGTSGYLQFNSSGGQWTNSGPAWANASARRYKENISYSPYSLKEILQYKPVRYTLKSDKTGTIHIGIIADDSTHIIPSLVTYMDGKVDGFNYTELIPVLIKSTQEQQGQIEQLKKRDLEQEKEIENLKARILQLEAK